MAVRPTEEDEFWTARQRLRKARREEIATLYRERVEPTLASGCHVPGRSVGPCPTVAHNSTKDSINYCGQVLEAGRPAVERLVRGDYYNAGPGGNVGEGPGARVEGKSFRCRSDQPHAAEQPPTPHFGDEIPVTSVRSTCGGRLISGAKMRNMGQSKAELPAKPLVDPLPGPNNRVAHARFESATRGPYKALRDSAMSHDVDPNCDLALEESKGQRRPHHCHHRHRDHHHGEPSYPAGHLDESVQTDGDDGSVAPGDAQRPTVPALPLGGAKQERPTSGAASRPSSRGGAFMAPTAASKAKEAQMYVERPSSAGSRASSAAPRPARRVDPYETALAAVRNEPAGAAAVMSGTDYARAQAIAHKPPTPRGPPARGRKPKDSANLIG